MIMFPKLKKKLSSFLLSEEGKISKQSLLTLGSFVSAAVIAGALATKQSAGHTNDITVSYQEAGKIAVGQHSHHNSDTGVCGSVDCGGSGPCSSE
jgi:hypothetical protein